MQLNSLRCFEEVTMSRFRPPSVCLAALFVLATFSMEAVAEEPAEDDVDPQIKEVDQPDATASGVVVRDNVDEDDPAGWTVEFYGYVRTQFTTIQNDPDFEQFGRHDGFSIADARVGFFGHLDNGLGFNLQVDAGTARPSREAHSAVGEVVTRLKDGYLFYEPHPLIRASAGQFKAPFDVEELISTSDMLFIERSVGNRGVLGIEGPNLEGLTQGRQVGLRLDSEPFFFVGDGDGPGVSYELAVTNGTPANTSHNDNDDVAYFGRVNLHWGDMVSVGGGGFYNDLTLGQPPDQLGETRTGFTADVLANAFGVSLLANIVQVDIEAAPEVAAEQTRTARAYQAQIAYEEPFLGIQPAYRFAYYDPATNLDEDETSPAFEALTYHTIGLNYNAQTYPVRLMLNYTLTQEDVRDIDNDRFDALVQVQW
jgi:hypothetical protein